MATVEQIIGQTPDGRNIVYFENAGPASYVAGGFTITITSLRTVERVLNIGNNGGFRSDIGEAVLSTNTVKIPAHYYAYACPSAPVCSTGFEVTTGVNISGTTFKGIVTGF